MGPETAWSLFVLLFGSRQPAAASSSGKPSRLHSPLGLAPPNVDFSPTCSLAQAETFPLGRGLMTASPALQPDHAALSPPTLGAWPRASIRRSDSAEEERHGVAKNRNAGQEAVGAGKGRGETKQARRRREAEAEPGSPGHPSPPSETGLGEVRRRTGAQEGGAGQARASGHWDPSPEQKGHTCQAAHPEKGVPAHLRAHPERGGPPPEQRVLLGAPAGGVRGQQSEAALGPGAPV